MENKSEYRVLFVCMGNRVRSVMAEAIFNSRASLDNGNKLIANSVGMIRLSGAPPAEDTAIVCSENGLDVSSHRSKQLDAGDIFASDLVLTMETGQMNHLKESFPDSSDKIFTIKGYPDTEEGDILDPYMEDIKVYRERFVEINNEIDRLMSHIISEAIKLGINR